VSAGASALDVLIGDAIDGSDGVRGWEHLVGPEVAEARRVVDGAYHAGQSLPALPRVLQDAITRAYRDPSAPAALADALGRAMLVAHATGAAGLDLHASPTTWPDASGVAAHAGGRLGFGALPFREAVAWFRRKGYLTSWHWADVSAQEHAAAFTVAKLARLDLLAAVKEGVDRGLADGETLRDFRKRVEPVLQQAGWWGRQIATDPVTRETREVQLGSPQRLATIFETNVSTAYAAGRWEQIARTADRRPYLRYVAVMDGRTRPAHRAWHGTVLRWDDPWWSTHAPPNGYRCRCAVQQLDDDDLGRRGWAVGTAPPLDLQPYTNPRTGHVQLIPAGLTPGFAFNPGTVPRLAQARAVFADRAAELLAGPAR